MRCVINMCNICIDVYKTSPFSFFLSFLFSLSSVSMVLYICRAGGARDHCKSGTNKDTLP
jgi:hypothetical protein